MGLLDRVNELTRVRCSLSKSDKILYKQKGEDAGISGLSPDSCDVDGVWPIHFWFEGYDHAFLRHLLNLGRDCFYDEQFMERKAYVSGWAIAYYGGWMDYCPDEYSDYWMLGFRAADTAVKQKRRLYPWFIVFGSAMYRSGWNIGRYGGDERCAPIHCSGTRSYENWFIGFESGLSARYRVLQKANRHDIPELWEPGGVMDDVCYEQLPENQ